MQTASPTSECSDAAGGDLGALLKAASKSSNRQRRGRRAPEPVSRPVLRLIKIAKQETPAYVQRYLNEHVAEVLDAELEALAVWVLSGFDPSLETDRIKLLLMQGAPTRAFNAIVMQTRREFADEVRRHKRSNIDKSSE